MSNDDDKEKTRLVAERLIEAFRAVGPWKRRPGFGHAARPGEFQLIHRLAHEAPEAGLRVGDLAGWLAVKPPTVTQFVDALESRGLVERFADPDDRRAIRVRLSKSGRSMADSFHARAMEETEALVGHLGAADGEKLAELLTKAAAFLSARHGDFHDADRHGGDCRRHAHRAHPTSPYDHHRGARPENKGER